MRVNQDSLSTFFLWFQAQIRACDCSGGGRSITGRRRISKEINDVEHEYMNNI